MGNIVTERQIGVQLQSWWLNPSWYSKDLNDTQKATVAVQYYKPMKRHYVTAVEFGYAAEMCVEHCAKYPSVKELLHFVDEYRRRKAQKNASLALPAPTVSEERAAANLEKIRLLSRFMALFLPNPRNEALLTLHPELQDGQQVYRDEYFAFLTLIEHITAATMKQVVELLESQRERLSHGKVTVDNYCQNIKGILNNGIR